MSTRTTAPRSYDVAPAVDSPRRAAVGDFLQMTPALFVFAVTIGAAATGAPGVGPATTVGGGWLVSGGSAQVVTTSIVQDGGGLVLAVLAGALANGRMMFYGAAMEPLFRQHGRWFRLLAVHWVVDTSYVAAMARTIHDADWFRRYWLTLGALLGVMWSSGLALGVLVAPVAPDLRHMALAIVGLFAPMLATRLGERPAMVAAVTAGAVMLASVGLGASAAVGLLAAPVAGMLAGVAAEGRS